MIMDLTQDPPCIIGSSCRLPGGVTRTDALWRVLNKGDWAASSTLPPLSRGFLASIFRSSPDNAITGRGGWLGEEGIELFDPQFFGISPSEVDTLRPNVRLGLELTWEALENAGIPPSSLRGKNVSVSIGVGTEDGWDMKRFNDDGARAFNRNWAQSSDPSGISGRIAHVFDFHGSCNTVSNACASGAFALRDAINSLYHDGAKVAIVCALATHFSPAPFGWAAETGVASARGRSSAFSPEADGYSPSEGAVCLVIKKYSAALSSGDSIHGMIRALATGHNGATRTFFTPNPVAQAVLSRKVLKAAKIGQEDVVLLETHGTGTPVGDAFEAEAIRSVFKTPRRNGEPLFLSSSKTVFGHCHGSAALVGLLKVLACFQERTVPPHHVLPHTEFLRGPVQIPVKQTPIDADGMLVAQVNTFGFTGSIASMIITSAPSRTVSFPPPFPRPGNTCCYLLPFSGRTKSALTAQIRSTCSWARENQCNMHDLAAVLSLCRDHHNYRHAIVASMLDDLEPFCANDFDLDGLPSVTCSDLHTIHADDRFTLKFLNLENLDRRVFDNDGALANFLENDHILEAASFLYNGGHTLAFSEVYNKHDIDPKVLHGLPFYQFDRKRHWRDAAECSYAPAKQMPANPSSVTQATFDSLVEKFGAPIEAKRAPKTDAVEPISHVLLTGGNGMLGVQLISRLLEVPSIAVYCILRGDPLRRLCASFTKHGLDTKQLHAAKSRGSLYLMHTSDISEHKFGLSDADYAMLVDSVDEIVHAAWKVNFGLPVAEFQPFLQCTRTLAELCLVSRKRVRYQFITTFASTYMYPEDLVPERPLEARPSVSLAQGYPLSKLVAEHSLYRILQAHPGAFHLVVIRIGQICGDTATGSWSENQMIPMMIASLPTLRAFPRYLPDVSWIPMDVCVDTLRDAVLAPRTNLTTSNPQILHVANPQITPWSSITSQIGQIAGIGTPSLLSLRDYVDLLQRAKGGLPISRLLPYFISCLEEGGLPERYASLEVAQTIRFSPSLASCPPIGTELLRKIVQSIMQNSYSMPPTSEASPVFLFGPWSAARKVAGDMSISDPVHERITELANKIRENLGDDLSQPDVHLEQQLQTLASHLTVVQRLADKGTNPSAVVGYCFGEYAAAITAGILSEEVVVNILVRRAVALRGVAGAMLNVFCELSCVRRHLACLSSPPSVAILAGLKHVVLSGTRSQIDDAQAELHRHGVKSILVDTTLPFHSAEMDAPALQVTSFAYDPRNSPIVYVSCVTGAALNGERLGLKYWLRHMREPVQFYRSMQFVRKSFPGAAILDIGPGVALAKMISRYEWPDVVVLDPENYTPSSSADARRRGGAATSTLPVESADITSQRHKMQSPTSTTTATNDQDPCQVALEIVASMFGYQPSPDLLNESMHSLGIQSMDFVRFSEHFGARTGISVSLSAFITDLSLESIIREAMKVSVSDSAALS